MKGSVLSGDLWAMDLADDTDNDSKPKEKFSENMSTKRNLEMK